MPGDRRTIFAAATPIGESGITVVRLSGPAAFEITGRFFSGLKAQPAPSDVSSMPSHTIHHGYVFDEGEIIDDAVLFVYKAPNSYTGEDVVEISTHGGPFVYRKLSELLVRRDASHALPGEFTKRAFLNGKLDLIQAEAVADLIRAKTDMASKSALRQLKGELSVKINDLRNELINYCSLVELELDFSEEGIEVLQKTELLDRIEKITGRINAMTDSYDSGRIMRDGINLAIVGSPNVGKSTIFNYLLNESRAIVSEIPGTTRDYLEESLILEGYVFNLVDTAGIRTASNKIETEGIRRSYMKMTEADIILDVRDLSNGSGSGSIVIRSNVNGKNLTVFNKLDIAAFSPNSELCISAKTGANIDKLKDAIVAKAGSLVKRGDVNEVFITNERHKGCLLKSCEYLENAKWLILEEKGNELISFEIREALNALSEIIGKTTNTDILNNIFTKFCIGK